jgi:hypothetical protein
MNDISSNIRLVAVDLAIAVDASPGQGGSGSNLLSNA